MKNKEKSGPIRSKNKNDNFYHEKQLHTANQKSTNKRLDNLIQSFFKCILRHPNRTTAKWTFIVVIKLALQACSRKRKNKPKEVFKFVLRALLYRRAFNEMKRFFNNKQREKLFVNEPNYLMKCMKPFLRVGFQKTEIAQLLNDHHTWVENTFTESAQEQIYLQEIRLRSLPIDEQEYYLTLNFDGKWRKEAELAVNIKDAQGHTYYSLGFTVQNHNIYIGCIQGNNNDQGFTKAFTKAFFGLRPKSFLVETAQFLAQHLKMHHIYAVKNSAHVYNAKRYSNAGEQVNMNYDQLWLESDAVEHDQWFYEIPLTSERRAIEDIKSSKRKLYRDRYQWLDDHNDTLGNAIKSITKPEFQAADSKITTNSL